MADYAYVAVVCPDVCFTPITIVAPEGRSHPRTLRICMWPLSVKSVRRLEIFYFVARFAFHSADLVAPACSARNGTCHHGTLIVHLPFLDVNACSMGQCMASCRKLFPQSVFASGAFGVLYLLGCTFLSSQRAEPILSADTSGRILILHLGLCPQPLPPA